MTIAEFQDSYSNTASFPTTFLLNEAVDRVLEEKGLRSDTEANFAVLHAVYAKIAQHKIKLTRQALQLALLNGENFEQSALNIVQEAVRSLAA